MTVYKIEKTEYANDKILKQRVNVKNDLIKWLNSLSIKKENIESSNNSLLSDEKERKL